LTEAIHPPLDHLSSPYRKRFEAFLIFFAEMPSVLPVGHGKCKRAAEAALRTRQALASKDDNHPAMMMMTMMVMVVPPVVAIVVVVVVMMVMMHSVSRRGLNRGGQCACSDENGYEGGSEHALEHDDLLDP
jgi:hypothetical protein